jgi:hypothetical protein
MHDVIRRPRHLVLLSFLDRLLLRLQTRMMRALGR